MSLTETLGNWWCLYSSRHSWRIVGQLSEQAKLCRCERCDRKWAVNHDVHSVLPWHVVSHFYKGE